MSKNALNPGFRNINDPLGIATGGAVTPRRVLDPLNVMPGNGRSIARTALDPAGLFGGGKKRMQNYYQTPDGVQHNGGGGVALTPEQKMAQRNIGKTNGYAMGPPGSQQLPAPAAPTGMSQQMASALAAARARSQQLSATPRPAAPASVAPATNTGIVPQQMLGQMAGVRLPGYADGGKVINRKPNGKRC